MYAPREMPCCTCIACVPTPAHVHDETRTRVPSSLGGIPRPLDYASSSGLLCATGHCQHNPSTFAAGSEGGVRCGIIGGAPPTTAVEFTFVRTADDDALDYYDVSQVDGFNVGVLMAPLPAAGDSTTGADEPNEKKKQHLAPRPAHAVRPRTTVTPRGRANA